MLGLLRKSHLFVYNKGSNVRTFANAKAFNQQGEELRFSYAFTSYFKLPEQGMTSYDMLSRSSLFFVKANEAFPKKYHILAPKHVTHPWLYNNFYPPATFPWLKFLRDDAINCKLGIREKVTGDLIEEFALDGQTFPHDKLDLIILHLKDESSFLEYLENNNLPFLPLTLSETGSQQNQEVFISGHNMVQNDHGEEVMIPSWTTGKVNFVTPTKVFVSTPEPVAMGMCGGPVVDVATKDCIGILEALVSPFTGTAKSETELAAMKKIENNAVHIDSKKLIEFVNTVEGPFASNTEGANFG